MRMSCDQLRLSLAGLIGFAAVEDELLAAARAAEAPEHGTPESWAALPRRAQHRVQASAGHTPQSDP